MGSRLCQHFLVARHLPGTKEASPSSNGGCLRIPSLSPPAAAGGGCLREREQAQTWTPFCEALGLHQGNRCTWGPTSAPSSSRKTSGSPNIWSFLLQRGGRCCRDSLSLSCGRAILGPWNVLQLGADSCHLSQWCQASGAPLAGWRGLPQAPHPPARWQAR